MLAKVSNRLIPFGLNESPSEKEGKLAAQNSSGWVSWASMKVPPKRKGNLWRGGGMVERVRRLNESPSEKEGK